MHLSAPHLCPAGTLCTLALDTRPRFAWALDQAAGCGTDLLIVSGDLTEHGDAESYALARQLLAKVTCPILAIPGNHDDR